MSPQDFVAKWRNNTRTERAASQSHFNDLCALLELADPNTADPAGDWFAFEKGVGKTGGGDGWADVWRRGCFAWEYKGPKKDLDGSVRISVCERAVEHYAAMALMKRSPKMTANWALAMDHSRGGIFHSFSERFKIR